MPIGSSPLGSTPLSSAPGESAPPPTPDVVINFESSGAGSSSMSFITGSLALSSSIGASSSLSVDLATQFFSKIVSSSEVTLHLENGNIDLASALSMTDVVVIPHILDLMSGLGLSGTATIEHTKVLSFVTSAVLGDEMTTQQNFNVVLASAMAIQSIAAYGYDIELVSAAEMADAIERRYNAVIEAQSELAASSELDISHELNMVLLSTAGASDAVDTQAELGIDLFSEAAAQVVFKLGDDVYQGWVFNIESAGFTEYAQYPFTSITMFKGKPYGTAEDGIYLLEGDDDAGDPIAAKLKTKMSTLRADAIKDAKAVYVGYTSTGKLVLKVTVDRNGELHEYWYQEKKGASGSMRAGRFTPGRGLRSTFWQFELANQNGDDFEVHDVTIMYELLSRRLR